MDGTLTQPMLDFPLIKAEMKIGPGPILESLAELTGERRAEAEAILLRHEKTAAENSTLNEGCLDLLNGLSSARIPTALITRNSVISASTVFAKHQIKMNLTITREDCAFKPSPVPLEIACQQLGVSKDQTWMVGDGLHDIESANAAGIRCVWISHGKPITFAAHPWKTVADLCELAEILRALPK
jgi:HAD superfamily hydrolase (TIGR01549 family)